MVLQDISGIFRKVVPWKNLKEHIDLHNAVFLDHFVGSTSSMLVHQLYKEYDKIVAIAADFESAQFLKSDLDDLATENAMLFPPPITSRTTSNRLSTAGLWCRGQKHWSKFKRQTSISQPPHPVPFLRKSLHLKHFRNPLSLSPKVMKSILKS
ncbi:MAG: hypothetical protein U5K69_25855 [Balneolaceae bacterium]|nr:hypothetical protein [Balneolaceae bacterium]